MRPGRRGTVAVAAMAAAVAFVFVAFRGAPAEAAYPLERLSSLLSRHVWSRISGAWRGAAASAENVRLRREVGALAVLRGDIDALERDNARLREMLGFSAKHRGRWIPAAVLSSGGGSAGAGRTLRVEAGSLAGVREGSAVVAPEGLAGLVTAGTAHTAEVRLVGDVRVRVACEVETGEAARPRGILCGGGEDMLVLRHMTNQENALPGARVITSGEGGVFPPGIQVGVFVESSREGASFEGVVRPSVDFRFLEDVFIRREE